MSGNVCDKCGKPVVQVPPPGSGWIHRSARDALNCPPRKKTPKKRGP